MERLRTIERLLARGELDSAIEQGESWWGPTPSLEDRVHAFRDLLIHRYLSSLAPAPCRLVYLNFDDPNEALSEPGDLTVWVELYENTPSRDEMEARAGGGDEYLIPVADLEAAELTLLYTMRMARMSLLQLREEKHPLGSAELRAGVHSGEDYRLLKKIRPFPYAFDFDAQVQAAEEALARNDSPGALRELLGMPPNLSKTQRARSERLWESALGFAKEAQTLPQVEQAIASLSSMPRRDRLSTVLRELYLRAANMHLGRQAYVPAADRLYRAGELPSRQVLEAAGLGGSVRMIRNRINPTYVQCDEAEPCTFGWAEIVDNKLEFRQLTTLPIEAYRVLEESFEFFNASKASQSLTRAAFLAFQAGYVAHAAYLTRKACELDPDNSVARRSREALLSKGVSEGGSKRDCLDTVLMDKPAAQAGLRRHGLDLR